MSFVHLCDLPSEILDHILDYAIPSHRVSGQIPYDPEWFEYWGGGERQPKSLPSLFFVNKLLSLRALAIFYDKAILELQPVNPPQFVLDSLERGLSLHLASGLVVTHRFCPAAYLRRIKQAYIFSGQSDAVNAEGYEASLRWLVQNTSVKDIHLSRRLMTRLRRARVPLNSAINASMHEHALSRTVYVWTKHSRSCWEQMRMREMTKIRGEAPPFLQIYLYHQHRPGDPVLDPRWDIRSSDDITHHAMSEPVSSFLDDLAAEDTACRLAKSSWEAPPVASLPIDRLYQVCFVVGPSLQEFPKPSHSNEL